MRPTSDGAPVRPISGKSFGMTMGQRLDIALTLPREKRAWPIYARREGARDQTGIILAAPGAAEATPIYSHSFDAGAAWAQLALQASLLGLHAHAMTGLNFATANAALGIPEGYRVEAAVAIGRLGDKEKLPESLRGRETPSPRRPRPARRRSCLAAVPRAVVALVPGAVLARADRGGIPMLFV